MDLTALNNLKAAVAAGKVATPAQQRLLAIFRQLDASRAQALSLLSSLPVLFGILLGPTVGMLSDRTRSRLGRRAPWILFGGLVGACFLIGVRFAPTVAVLVILWVVAQCVLGVASGPMSATVADRIPEARIGMVSSFGGLGNLVGGLIGAVIAGVAFASLGLNLYFLYAGCIVVGTVCFVFLVKDRPSTALQRGIPEEEAVRMGLMEPLPQRERGTAEAAWKSQGQREGTMPAALSSASRVVGTTLYSSSFRRPPYVPVLVEFQTTSASLCTGRSKPSLSRKLGRQDIHLLHDQ